MTRARDIADVGYKDELVDDTTPQLGGALDAQTNNIANVDKLAVGESSVATQRLIVSQTNNAGLYQGIKVKNFGGSNAVAGVYFQGYDWTQGGIWHGRSATTGTNRSGALVLGTNPNTSDLSEEGLVGRLIIDNAGRVTMPSQPAFTVYTNSSTSIGNTIQFGGASFNVGSHFNTSTGVFTAPVAGKYWFYFNVLQDRTTTTGEGYVDLYKNGGTHFRAYSIKESSISQHVEYKGGVIVQLSTNDTVNLHLQAIIGSGETIISNFNHCKFSGYLMG